MKSLNDIANQLEADLAALRRAEEVLARFNGDKARGALGGKLAAALGIRNGHSNGNGNGHLKGKPGIEAAIAGRTTPIDRAALGQLSDQTRVSRHYIAVLLRKAGWIARGRATTTTWHPPGGRQVKPGAALSLSEMSIGEAIVAVADTLPTPFSGPRDLVTALAAQGVTTSATYCGQVLRKHGYHSVGSGSSMKWARGKATTKGRGAKGGTGGSRKEQQRAGVAEVYGLFGDSARTKAEALELLIANGRAKKSALKMMKRLPAMVRYGYLKADGDGFVQGRVPDLVTPSAK